MTAPAKIEPGAATSAAPMSPAELADALAALKMKPAELARLIGVHRSTVSRWRSGKCRVPAVTALALRYFASRTTKGTSTS